MYCEVLSLTTHMLDGWSPMAQKQIYSLLAVTLFLRITCLWNHLFVGKQVQLTIFNNSKLKIFKKINTDSTTQLKRGIFVKS